MSGTRLGSALLAYLVLTTAIVTLVPFQFRPPPAIVIEWTGGWKDIVANVVLFFPLGFLYHFARSGPRSVREALVYSLLLSVLFEVLQLMLPDRFTSVVDVAANGLGGLLGALAYRGITTRAMRGVDLAGWTALELPLMGVVYLLLPLLWLDSVSAAAARDAGWLAALLGVIGATIIGALQRHLFARAGVFRPWESALLAAVWLVVGTYPVIWSSPAVAIPCLALSVGIVVAIGSLRTSGMNQRFEVPVISWVIPLFVIYLLLLAISPAAAASSFSLEFGFGRSLAGAGTAETLRLLEYVSGFTLLGYMIAEMGSRREETHEQTRARILRVTVPLALLFEVLRGFHPMHGGSPLLLAGAAAGSLYGGLIYHLARAHARDLRLARAGAVSPPQVPPGS